MKALFLGQNPVRSSAAKIDGAQVLLDGEAFYRIANSDRLRPFFLSLVSSADLWMFVSSNGALTAGRRSPDCALFPYDTDDKIHDGAEITGPKTIFIVRKAGRQHLWEPGSERGRGIYRTRRNLYKNLRGDKIFFEEINDDLGLTFCLERFGDRAAGKFSLSAEVATFLDALTQTLHRHRGLLAGPVTDAQRRRVLDALGRAGSEYRQRLYTDGFSGRTTPVVGQHLLDFLASALAWTNHSIAANRRPDGLYHAYNLIRLEDRQTLPVRRLYEMLEGLGSIYWHMVSKLRLAAQETFLRADGSPFAQRLAECYHAIRAGIGDFKTPEEYGAFPMDPYSHTPAHTGARQPGLTGQVKEDILCRFGELGVSVQAGCIHFTPRLLRRQEFLPAPAAFTYLDVAGSVRTLRLAAGSLAFTYCQVPVVYRLAPEPFLTVTLADGRKQRQEARRLDAEDSRAIFERRGRVAAIVCGLSSALAAAAGPAGKPR